MRITDYIRWSLSLALIISIWMGNKYSLYTAATLSVLAGEAFAAYMRRQE